MPVLIRTTAELHDGDVEGFKIVRDYTLEQVEQVVEKFIDETWQETHGGEFEVSCGNYLHDVDDIFQVDEITEEEAATIEKFFGDRANDTIIALLDDDFESL